MEYEEQYVAFVLAAAGLIAVSALAGGTILRRLP
jgi:hypothetical protein